MKQVRYWSVVGLAWLLMPALGTTAEPSRPNSIGPERAAALRAAVEDWTAMFPDRQTQGREYLARLAGASSPAVGKDASQLAAEWESLQREALAANPLVSGQPLLFVVRRQYRPDHHNTETMFQTGEINTGSFQGGGALKTIDFATGQVKTLLDVPEGMARDPDVSFDGTKILFSMRRNREDDYHLYEINADGTGLRQLTFGAGVTDIDPIYLPDGRILFTSTREPKYCMCNRHIMGNLFTMDADGANIQQIGHSTLHEGHASLLPDGRVLYDRWEYVDRNFGDAQGVWTVQPRRHQPRRLLGQQHQLARRGARRPRRFPARNWSAGQLLLLPRPALGRAGHRRPPPGRGRTRRRWCAPGRPTRSSWSSKGNYDTFTRVNPKYEDPYPLSDKVLPLLADDRPRRADGDLPAGRLRQRGAAARGGAGLLRPHAAGAAARPPVIPSRIDLTQDRGLLLRGERLRRHGHGDGRARHASSICAWSSRRRSGSGPARPGTAAPASRRPAWPGTISTTSGSSARCRSSPTAALTSPCRPTRSSISSCWTSRA